MDREFYLDPSKPLIPVLIGSPDIPGFLKARQSFVLGDNSRDSAQVVDEIIRVLKNPATSVDAKKLALGLEARESALKSFREYSLALGEAEVRRAGL